MAAMPLSKITLADYLAVEERSETKHEFVNGEILAMEGASLSHNRVASNLAGLLFNALKGNSCAPYGSDFRLCVEETGLYAYPDAMIVCGTPTLQPGVRPDTLLNPVAIVEILSESTESWDRGAKASHYRRIPSLREIFFISQSEIRVEQYVRQSDGRWLLHAELLGPGSGVISFTSCSANFDVAELYSGVLPELA